MPDAQGLHRCPVCFKGYKRREHLQRHRSSHKAERPHRCFLCNASFQRTDVLKRHLQTCDGVSSVSTGRRRACDRCVRQKKACNSLQPCQNCEKRAVQCQYPNAANAANANNANNAASAGPSGPPVHTQSEPSCTPQGYDSDINSDFGDVPLNDLDTMIHESATGFPNLEDPNHQVQIQNQDVAVNLPHDWFGIEFPDPSTAKNPQSDDRSSPPSEYRGYTFDFLYDFTSRTGLVSSFEYATLERRQQIVSAFDHAYLERQQPDSFHPTGIPALPPFAENNLSADGGLDIVSWSYWLHNPIVIKLQEIVLIVKNVVTVKPNNSTVTLTWLPATEQRCLHFFSPYRFTKFIELYWSVWHPNVNIVHRPTFDPASSKPILLAAMALIGACVSPDQEDNNDARMWFNCVEEMVFTDEDFCSDMELAGETPPLTSSPTSLRKLQALQAAYIVCLYQNWEGTDASKRRIRRYRFSTVVSVARDIGIGTARHLDYTRQSKHEFQWNEYVVREELIRTFLWIFLLDTAFVIFNNLPHRMVIKEMKMHMASPEPCFQAVTAEECIEQIHLWMPPSSGFCSLLLRDAIEKVCADTMTPDEQQQFSQLGPLNLFVIVSTFHYMIFQHQNSFGVEGQLVPIRNGLRNWIAIWERYFDSWSTSYPYYAGEDASLSPETMWKRVGFIRFSPEYWLLGSLLIDRISTTTATAQEQSQVNTNFNQGSIEDPENTSGRVQARSMEPILDKYDQTSMRQVNDLISDFQKIQFD